VERVFKKAAVAGLFPKKMLTCDDILLYAYFVAG
jgi:hypothetical protein